MIRVNIQSDSIFLNRYGNRYFPYEPFFPMKIVASRFPTHGESSLGRDGFDLKNDPQGRIKHPSPSIAAVIKFRAADPTPTKQVLRDLLQISCHHSLQTVQTVGNTSKHKGAGL